MNRETGIQGAIHDAIAFTGRALIWRNQCGAYKRGRHYIAYGLGVGSADLVGLLIPSGRFFALEVKTEVGKLSAEQRAWAFAVQKAGGYVACVRSVGDALEALKQAEETCSR